MGLNPQLPHPLPDSQGFPRTRAGTIAGIVFPQPLWSRPKAGCWGNDSIKVQVHPSLAVMGHLDMIRAQAIPKCTFEQLLSTLYPQISGEQDRLFGIGNP